MTLHRADKYLQRKAPMSDIRHGAIVTTDGVKFSLWGPDAENVKCSHEGSRLPR